MMLSQWHPRAESSFAVLSALVPVGEFYHCKMIKYLASLLSTTSKVDENFKISSKILI